MNDLDQAIINVESLLKEVEERTFLPKRFRKMPKGPELELALDKYADYLENELKRLRFSSNRQKKMH